MPSPNIERRTEQELANALQNALAMLQAVYQFVDLVNGAGGPTCISGIASCKTMIDSLNKNRKRFQGLVVDPGNAALAKFRGQQ